MTDAGLEQVESAACRDCETKFPQDPRRNLCAMRRMNCLAAEGKATAGPKAGAMKADLCEEVLACYRRTSCAASENAADGLVRCLCGAVTFDECVTMAEPPGMCRDEIFAGTETRSVAEVGARLTDAMFAAGLAGQVLQCDHAACKKSCGLCGTSATCADSTLGGAAGQGGMSGGGT